jgi:hypothetical protein
MESSNSCHRIVLAGNSGCRVLYCEECNVAEVEVGALSLRLEMTAFNSLGEMLQEAMNKLTQYRMQTLPKNPTQVWVMSIKF